MVEIGKLELEIGNLECTENTEVFYQNYFHEFTPTDVSTLVITLYIAVRMNIYGSPEHFGVCNMLKN